MEKDNSSEDILVQTLLSLKKGYVCGEHPLEENQRRLGIGPDGRYRHEEFLIGNLLESISGKKFFRYYENNDFDFISENQTYDVVGPVPPYYFDYNSFILSFNKHLGKQNLDYVVACTIALPKQVQEEFKDTVINSLPEEEQLRTIIVDETLCRNLIYSDHTF